MRLKGNKAAESRQPWAEAQTQERKANEAWISFLCLSSWRSFIGMIHLHGAQGTGGDRQIHLLGSGKQHVTSVPLMSRSQSGDIMKAGWADWPAKTAEAKNGLGSKFRARNQLLWNQRYRNCVKHGSGSQRRGGFDSSSDIY